MEKYLVDEMLLRLGRWLRLLGADVANPGGLDDPELTKKAEAEERILITRDRGLARSCEASGVQCILIESNSLEDQLREMAERGVSLEINPVRCTICNAPLTEVEVTGEATPSLQVAWRCEACGKLYWKGSHWRRMEEVLERIRDRDG